VSGHLGAATAGVIANAISSTIAPTYVGATYRYHDFRYYNHNVDSTFTYIYTGQLYSRCNYDDPYSFITSEMWRVDASVTSWTEMGDIDGTVNNQCWTGGFMAFDTPGVYVEQALYPYRPWIGWHSYELASENVNHYSVDYYYNGYLVGTARQPRNYGWQTQVGIESASSSYGFFENFTKGVTAQGSMQVFSCCAGWYYWPVPPNVPEYDEFWPTVYSTYSWQKSGGPIANYY